MAQILEKIKFSDQQIDETVYEVLDDFQAQDVIRIALPDSCGYAEAIIIATGRSSRQMGAIADIIKKRLGSHLNFTIQIEGLEKSEWVLIDLGHLIVHLFKPELRAFYQLEKLWDND